MLPQGKVRIEFAKTGKIKYVSHLDLTRTMKSAFIRAGIPIWYTEGFNPRPKMVFALTVSVGSESLCEFLDIRLNRPMEEREFVARLQAQLTDDIRIRRVYAPKSDFTQISYCTYRAELDGSFSQEEADRMLASPVVVTRHGKKGDRESDIRPMIRGMRCSGEEMELTLSASPDAYLNPEYVMKGVCNASGGRIDYWEITRTGCFFEDGRPFE